jgi:hypothetical protein
MVWALWCDEHVESGYTPVWPLSLALPAASWCMAGPDYWLIDSAVGDVRRYSRTISSQLSLLVNRPHMVPTLNFNH